MESQGRPGFLGSAWAWVTVSGVVAEQVLCWFTPTDGCPVGRTVLFLLLAFSLTL